ncbi:nucleotide exchange factor GrpE [Terrisporobacter sp.]|uniref:nucleotide exchange factor GrpE n=1 Tax=Terrisporobacter sp. TaxID=1965305 RepID=UPI0026299415|nr:nucleotide exchange factor GrpE [Terrisporobacter sp.]
MSEIQKGTNTADLNDIYEAIRKIRRDIKLVNKNTKKNILSVECLKNEMSNSNEQIFRLKKELEQKNFDEVKIYRKILILLDQLDNVYKFAHQCENKALIDNLNSVKKITRKEISEINLCEINPLGDLFNPDIHRCISRVEDSSKEHGEIISVIETGYILKGKVLRPALVIVAK